MTCDLNGNTLSNGMNTSTWDIRNRTGCTNGVETILGIPQGLKPEI